jgi:DNA-binding response OmpR family regulator
VKAVNSGDEALRSLYDFITKPCGIEEIVSEIEAAFERNQIKAKKGSA